MSEIQVEQKYHNIVDIILVCVYGVHHLQQGIHNLTLPWDMSHMTPPTVTFVYYTYDHNIVGILLA
jgi:hypothetical protein